MRSVLHAVEELAPGDKWGALYAHLAPGYQRWFLKEGDAARPSYLAGVRALRTFMPELLPAYQRLVELAGGGDLAARLLSLYRPTPYLTGCSQAVWTRGEPLLVRNYDYSPGLWDGVLLHSAWTGRHVIGMSDCLWGVLDGVNDAGLSVALAFGGRKVVGDGFGVPLILRYVLELCDSATQAAEVLQRVPSHMAYNVTVTDAAGDYFTAYINPDQPTVIAKRRMATNHQRVVEWDKFAQATGSLDRERFLIARIDDEGETVDRFVGRFLEPPLYSTRFDHGWGTLYTAVYRPATRTAVYRWPGLTLSESFTSFQEATLTIEYPA